MLFREGIPRIVVTCLLVCSMLLHAQSVAPERVSQLPGDYGWGGGSADDSIVVWPSADLQTINWYDLETRSGGVVATVQPGSFVWIVHNKGRVVVWNEKTSDGRQARIWMKHLDGGAPVEVVTADASMELVDVSNQWLLYTLMQPNTAHDLFCAEIDFDASHTPYVLRTVTVTEAPDYQWAGSIEGDKVYYCTSPGIWGPTQQIDFRVYDLLTGQDDCFMADPAASDAIVGKQGHMVAYLDFTQTGASFYPLYIVNMQHAGCAGFPKTFIANVSAGIGMGPAVGFSGDLVAYLDADDGLRVHIYSVRTGRSFLVSQDAADAVMISGPYVVWISGGAIFAANLKPILRVTEHVSVDGTAEVSIMIDISIEIVAVAAALEYDPRIAKLSQISKGSMFQTIGEPFSWITDRVDSSCSGPQTRGAYFAVIVSQDGSRVIPPGTHELARLVFRRDMNDPTLRCGTSLLGFTDDCIGAPPIRLLAVTPSGEKMVPMTQDGSLVARGRTFVRGDVDGGPGNPSGSVDIADAVRVLFHLFAHAPIACQRAADANDDGAISIADAIYILGFLFAHQPPPPAPFPLPGTNPTADGLTCNPCA